VSSVFEEREGERKIPNDSVLSHLGLGLTALGTRGCGRRGNVQVGRPMHTIGPRYTVRTSFFCPNKATTHTLWRFTREARGYGAGEVIVGEQVDND
jgi:hypothetical protein